MKFGKTLERIQVPEWARYYLAYKILKQKIKNIIQAQKSKKPNTEDLVTAFFYFLDRELEKVNGFFLYKQSEMERRLLIYQERYRQLSSDPSRVYNTDTEQETVLLAALNETRDQLNKVLRFAEANKDGFRKILKKFDKKLHRETQDTYLSTKVTVLPFASSPVFSEMVRSVETIIRDVKNVISDRENVTSTTTSSQPSVSPTTTTQQPTTKTLLHLSDAEINEFVNVIQDNNTSGLETQLKTILSKRSDVAQGPIFDSFESRLLHHLLTKACHCRSMECIKFLLDRGASPVAQKEDVNERNLIHRLVINGGAVKDTKMALKPANGSVAYASLNMNTTTTGEVINTSYPLHTITGSSMSKQQQQQQAASPITPDDTTLLDFILSYLHTTNPSSLRETLFASDVFGRKPLHYAAILGQPAIITCLLNFMKRVANLDDYRGCTDSVWLDHEGYSPFFYAVVKGHAKALEVLIDAAGVKDVDISSSGEPHATSSVVANVFTGRTTPIDVLPHHPKHIQSHTPLALSCTYGHAHVASLLISRGANINFADEDGETPLHISCRHGFVDCVRVLLNAKSSIPIKPDATEKYCGWSPLFMAAIQGRTECVHLVLNAGADMNLVDFSGWTAYEHAVFRAHRETAILLAPTIKPTKPRSKHAPTDTTATSPTPSQPPSPRRGSGVLSADRAYGHKFLQNEAMLVIHLGTIDTRKPVMPAVLDETKIPAMQLSSSYSLVVTAEHCTGEPAIFDLPIKETNPEPIIFYTNKLEDVVMKFDIVPTFGSGNGASRTLIGRATALMSTAKTPMYKERTSLGGSVSLPILGAGSLEKIGMVTFEYVVVKPFKHPNLKVGVMNTYWKSISTKVIGHRGSGANRLVKGSANLQLGENTVLSFVTAASLGAEYVEFDVQLTKDHVPVLYHDWTVTESGYHIPVNAVTLHEFLRLHPHDAPAGRIERYSSFNGSTNRAGKESAEFTATMRPKSASSLNGKPLGRSNSMINLAPRDIIIDHGDTIEPVPLGGKGNSVGTIQAPFATLEETFKKVPKHIGFNIEVKYPQIEEAERDDLQQAELNLFVDKILDCVYDFAQERNIIFSSFHPEICLMLNLKQCNYPVFFLTEGGVCKTADIRCSSLQEAVRFAKRTGLLGIVSDSTPLIEAPNLIPAIRETGLLVFTYGAKNNDIKNAQVQRDFGVDAVIVDSVAKVRNGLYSADEEDENVVN